MSAALFPVDVPETGARVRETSSVLGNEKSLARPLLEDTGTLVISTRSTTALLMTSSRVWRAAELLPFPVFCFRSIVRPEGMLGAAASLALAAALRSMAVWSKEMVFFRPRFVVPGTFGPVELDVYLMISVSEGSFSESNIEGEPVAREYAEADADGEDVLELLPDFEAELLRLLLPEASIS